MTLSIIKLHMLFPGDLVTSSPKLSGQSVYIEALLHRATFGFHITHVVGSLLEQDIALVLAIFAKRSTCTGERMALISFKGKIGWIATRGLKKL